ncbi:MAG: hypothetical protein IJ638_01615, partial [Alphaproteobacteria bacterium]|nr:hypothetical protein [Alphaproteobacteria bacterium]
MNFFKKLFAKKEISLQDVFNSLDGFSNDIKTLRDFSEVAFAYFGNNWKFNLEMYISSLPEPDKQRYYDKFKNVMEYEKALSVWTLALQIVKGVKPVSAELLKSMPEYKMYLSKFGIEGERLFEKLNSMFDVLNEEEKIDVGAVQAEKSEEIVEEESGEEVVSEPLESSIEAEEGEVLESVDDSSDIEDVDNTEKSEEESFYEVTTEDGEKSENLDEVDEEDDDVVEKKTSYELPDKQEFHKELKARILQKVRDIELRKKALQEKRNNEEKEQEFDKKTVKTETKSKKARIEVKNQGNNQENTDLILENFKKIDEFLSQSRQIMSAISIYKKSPSVEEYKNYGFILDTIDYLIEK